MPRPSGRAPDQMRVVSLEPGFAKYAEGSCLVRFGDTHVLCTASVEDRVPPFRRNSGKGWVTAEYGMLPRATTTRTQREATAGKVGGRFDLHRFDRLQQRVVFGDVPASPGKAPDHAQRDQHEQTCGGDDDSGEHLARVQPR